MCQKKETVKKCRIRLKCKEVVPMDMKDFSPEEQEEYNRILREESQGTGISIYDYYDLDQNDF